MNTLSGLVFTAVLLGLWSTKAGEMTARQSPTGQVILQEGTKPILQYNYRTVEPGELLAKISEGNRIYARPRSDYIHPLYGLNGEVLTRDWSLDHPHHRGIYWAWPEVDYGTNRGDLHALQKVFARPTGRIELRDGADFAEVEAVNQWLWDDREAIVRETTAIRAFRATPQGRKVDLFFSFLALKDGVTLARRGTEHYGGLNVRLETPRDQQIFTRTSPAGDSPRRAWCDLSGVFGAAASVSGLMVLQHRGNPDYPGDWIQYPELSWCQPTFPAAKTRFALSKSQPLVLRYRLWIHGGSTPTEPAGDQLWDVFNLEIE